MSQEYDDYDGAGAIVWMLLAISLLIGVCVGVGGTAIILSVLGG